MVYPMRLKFTYLDLLVEFFFRFYIGLYRGHCVLLNFLWWLVLSRLLPLLLRVCLLFSRVGTLYFPNESLTFDMQ